MTLTVDLLTPKGNQHIYEPKYICDQNWVKFPSLVFEIWCSQGYCCDIDLLHFDPKIYSAHLWTQIHSCHNLVKFLSLVFEIVFTRFSGRTDSRTHSRMDRLKYRMPPAPFSNLGGGIKQSQLRGPGPQFIEFTMLLATSLQS